MSYVVAIQVGNGAAFFREDGWLSHSPEDATAYDDLDSAVEELRQRKKEFKGLAYKLFVAEV
jgi:hypothetical protein